ncbi:MAG: DUF2442 domain-containing protein [Dehalococcoidia bacterium]|nr:DUF2442 domain-containing protein [Dehalococcoidia bacterium]
MRRAKSVLRVGDKWLDIECTTGEVVRLVLTTELDGGPVMRELRDPDRFGQVRVDELGALEWANGASLAPEHVTQMLDAVPAGS